MTRERAPREPVPPRQSGPVLVVDDDPVCRTVAVAFLERLGYRVEAVEDGASALAALATRGPYGLVLMDWLMPEMDGVMAVREIRRRELDGGVPIVAVTAGDMPGNREACLAAGMNDYLAKPIKLAELQQALTRWCR